MPTMTTTGPVMGGGACPFSQSSLAIPNGYATNVNGLTLLNMNQAASGSYIDYACAQLFTLTGNSRMICSNGVWSPTPSCVGK